jgi:hypothetical protein
MLLVDDTTLALGSFADNEPEMAGSVNEIDHLGCRMDRQR